MEQTMSQQVHNENRCGPKLLVGSYQYSKSLSYCEVKVNPSNFCLDPSRNHRKTHARTLMLFVLQ